jgi:hypothetical protein
MPRADRATLPRTFSDYFPDELANSVVVEKDGEQVVAYCPQPHQVPFHASNASNLLALGTRGTGKSKQLRWDAIIRCLMFPNFRALILRRTIPDLRKSHLAFIAAEMELLGGKFLWTTFEAKFPNGSVIQFSHCETIKDVLNFLSSEWGFIGFDELSTFDLDMFLQISAAARAPADAPYVAVVRAGTNPLGPGAPWLKSWFVDHDVNLVDFPDYLPEDFEMQFQTLEQNKYIDKKTYEKRLRNLPDHIRKAWLLGEFVIEGAYFTDFVQRKLLEPEEGVRDKEEVVQWHVIDVMPTYRDPGTGQDQEIFSLSWMSIYRAVDWGYFPDPAVCLWIAVFPNKRAVPFMERHWRRTLAKDVATQIKNLSKGMRILDTFCDPTMFIKDGASKYSIAEQFETNGVPLTPAQNNREVYGTAIHDYLNTIIDDRPQLQIMRGGHGKYGGCPELIKTLPVQQMDENDPRKIANGNDHWVVSLAYFCMGNAMPAREPHLNEIPRWMRPKQPPRMLASM